MLHAIPLRRDEHFMLITNGSNSIIYLYLTRPLRLPMRCSQKAVKTKEAPTSPQDSSPVGPIQLLSRVVSKRPKLKTKRPSYSPIIIPASF